MVLGATARAGRHGFQASSVNYGSAPRDAESLLADACPIVASYGAKDWSQRHAATGWSARYDRRRRAQRQGVPGRRTLFLNDHQDQLFKMLKIVGSADHEPSRARRAATHRMLQRPPEVVVESCGDVLHLLGRKPAAAPVQR